MFAHSFLLKKRAAAADATARVAQTYEGRQAVGPAGRDINPRECLHRHFANARKRASNQSAAHQAISALVDEPSPAEPKAETASVDRMQLAILSDLAFRAPTYRSRLSGRDVIRGPLSDQLGKRRLGQSITDRSEAMAASTSAISASLIVVPSPPTEKSAIGAGDAAPRLCLLRLGGEGRCGSSSVPKRSTGATRAWPLGGQRRKRTRRSRRTSDKVCARVPREWPDAARAVCWQNLFGA